MAAPVDPLVGAAEHIQQMHLFHAFLDGGLKLRQSFQRYFLRQLSERWLSFFGNHQFMVVGSGTIHFHRDVGEPLFEMLDKCLGEIIIVVSSDMPSIRWIWPTR